jgi:hypothetical protein
MGRTRQPLNTKREGACFVVRFKHPLTGKTTRLNLGTEPVKAEETLRQLNRIFENEDYHANPPLSIPEPVRNLWGGGPRPKITMPAEFVLVPQDQDPAQHAESLQLTDEQITALDDLGLLDEIKGQDQSDSDVVAYTAREIRFLGIILEKERAIKQLTKELENLMGKRLRPGPCPSMQECLDTWLSRYQGRDPGHTKTVSLDLERFVDKFGADKPVDSIENKEPEIAAWLNGLKVADKRMPRYGQHITAGRRAQIRRHVLKFLEDSGVRLNRKAVDPVRAREIRTDRGAIRWLDAKQRDAVHRHLPPMRIIKNKYVDRADKTYWQDIFFVQCAIGLRPEELPTLAGADFSPDYHELVLTEKPAHGYTLKNGSRKITLPPAVARVLKARLAKNEFAFACPLTGRPWKSMAKFCTHYRKALDVARIQAGIPFKLDCRVPRRTCASILVRAGRTTDAVAKLLGDDPDTIREHYGALQAHEVDTRAAVIYVARKLAPKQKGQRK